MSTSPTPAYTCSSCGGQVWIGVVHHCPTAPAQAARRIEIKILPPPPVIRDLGRARALFQILGEVAEERARQEAKHPLQELPNGTDRAYTGWSNVARTACDKAALRGELTWRHILEEEFAESLAEEGDDLLRVELLHVAAVAVRWIEAIDRRNEEQSRKAA